MVSVLAYSSRNVIKSDVFTYLVAPTYFRGSVRAANHLNQGAIYRAVSLPMLEHKRSSGTADHRKLTVSLFFCALRWTENKKPSCRCSMDGLLYIRRPASDFRSQKESDFPE